MNIAKDVEVAMGSRTDGVVYGEGGLRGTLEPPDASSHEGAGTRVVILDDGRKVVVPAALLVARPDGGYDLPLGLAEVDRLTERSEVVIPVVAEEVEVGKRTVEIGRVRVTKVVREREEVVAEPLTRDEVTVERVPVGRVADGLVGVRQEGDTMIIPLLEEVLVVEKRLMVREELRITRRRVLEDHRRVIPLREEDAVVERLDAHQGKKESS
jgi:uncharacterized protein (TIGR02271 family)